MQLRDIFRIHPDTFCNTHDLLECPCDGKLVTDDDASAQSSVHSDDEDSDTGFITASAIKPGQISKIEKEVGFLNLFTHCNDC